MANNDLDTKILRLSNKVANQKPKIQTVDPSTIVWDDPEQLNNISVQNEFPLKVIPDPIRQAIEVVANNDQIPFPIVTASAINSLSIGAQGLYNVQRPGMNPTPVGINNIVIAESGDRKTTSDSKFIQPLMKYLKDSESNWEEKIKNAVIAHRVWDTTIKGIIKRLSNLITNGNDKTTIEDLREKLNKLGKEEPDVPENPCICVEDVTQEALVSVLEKNPTVGLNSSEGSCVFGGLGFNSDNIKKMIATINKAYSGEDQETIRKTTVNIILDGSQRLTVNIMIQKEVLLEILNKNRNMFIESGFLARFNICEVKSLQGTRLKKNHADLSVEPLEEYNSKIYSLIKTTFEYRANKENQPIILTFSKEAEEFWIERCDNIESRLKTDFSCIKSSASKGAEQIARMAALFHIITYFNGALDSVPTEISLDSVVRASEVEEWYLLEVARINFTRKANYEISEAEKKLGAMARACVKNGKIFLTSSEVGKYTGLTSEEYKPLLDKLEDKGCVRIISDGGKGKMIYIHPKAIEEARVNESKVVPLTKRSASKKKKENTKARESNRVTAKVVSDKTDVSTHTLSVSNSAVRSDNDEVDFSEVEDLVKAVGGK